jgi:hypothetical protein
MAIFTSGTVRKNLRHRGPHAGKDFTVSGNIIVPAAGSYALADTIRIVKLGENQRPVRLVLKWTPLSGTPVLTNPTFTAGVIADTATTFTRQDGTTYPVTPTSATALATGLTLNADNMNTIIEVSRPVADSVPNYGPYIVTLTPSGAGAFSVAGGSGMLSLEVTTIGEENPATPVFTQYLNLKVNN